jgi:hypothetical protein
MFKKLFAVALALLLKSCTIPDNWRNGYLVRNHQVWHFHGFPATGFVIDEADYRSFKSINNDYGKDKDHVFYTYLVIPKADPASFEYLGDLYGKDNKHGFYVEKMISEDGAHFGAVPNCQDKPYSDDPVTVAYVRDSKKVYKQESVIEGADAGTFVFVPMFNGYNLAHDKHVVYWSNGQLPGADGQSFKRVCENMFKDKNGAWYLSLGKDVSWEKMPDEVDLPTLVGIKRLYARDKNHIYYKNTVVEAADKATFEELDNHLAKDKNGQFSSGYRIKPDSTKTQ